MMVFGSIRFFFSKKESFPLIIYFYCSSFTSYCNTAVPLSCFHGLIQSLSLQRGLEILMKLVQGDVFCESSSSPIVEKLSVAGSGKIKGNVTHVYQCE